MEPTSEQVEKLKTVELEMLREFIKVCEKLSLKYYLLYGTLLGAIRHKGFIPWDDDIDVGMPREDYEVFLQRGQELLPKHLFLQTIYSDNEYLMCFAKIRNSNTTFIETSVNHRKINHGIYIDIFPLDYYPEETSARKQLDRKKWMYNFRVASEFNLSTPRSMKYKMASTAARIMIPSVKKILLKRDSLYKSVPESELLISHGGAWGEKEITPRCWYGEGTEVEFEGLAAMAPKEYHKWLEHVYGNYMQLPPVEKRVGHHFADVIDSEKPFTDYWTRKE